jgi:hypothetical protein
MTTAYLRINHPSLAIKPSSNYRDYYSDMKAKPNSVEFPTLNVTRIEPAATNTVDVNMANGGMFIQSLNLVENRDDTNDNTSDN